MRFSAGSLAVASLIGLSQACYRTTGAIQQHINTCTHTTYYLPSIYLQIDNVQICNGHLNESNAYQDSFIPGGLPTNSSFSGPFAASDCNLKSVQVDIQGVNGQALIRDFKTAFYINPENMGWQQVGTGWNLAGIDCISASYWEWDSGFVHC